MDMLSTLGASAVSVEREGEWVVRVTLSPLGGFFDGSVYCSSGFLVVLVNFLRALWANHLNPRGFWANRDLHDASSTAQFLLFLPYYELHLQRRTYFIHLRSRSRDYQGDHTVFHCKIPEVSIHCVSLLRNQRSRYDRFLYLFLPGSGLF